MLSCRERKTHKYGFAGVIGRGYSLTWQERERVVVLSLLLFVETPNHSSTPTMPRGTTTSLCLSSCILLLPLTTQSLSASSPRHIPFSCFLYLILCIITFLIIIFPQIFLNFSLPHTPFFLHQI